MFGLPRLLALGLLLFAQDDGFDPKKISSLREELQKFVDRNETAGVVALAGRRGRKASVTAVGWQDVEKKLPMKPDTIFRIASMTKPVTAIAVLMLEE